MEFTTWFMDVQFDEWKENRRKKTYHRNTHKHIRFYIVNFERHTQWPIYAAHCTHCTQIIIVKSLILISGINIVTNSFPLRATTTIKEYEKKSQKRERITWARWESFITDIRCRSCPYASFAIRSIMKDPLNKLQLKVICVLFRYVSFDFVLNNNTVSLRLRHKFCATNKTSFTHFAMPVCS